MYTFGRNTGTDFYIRLLHNHSPFDWFASSTTKLCRNHPFPVCVGEAVDRNDADTAVVVTALAWAKANAPASLAVTISWEEYEFLLGRFLTDRALLKIAES